MSIQASDYFKHYNEEITRYRNMEWQISGASVASSWGMFYLISVNPLAMAKISTLASVFVVLLVVALVLAEFHIHGCLNEFRVRKECLIKNPNGEDHKNAFPSKIWFDFIDGCYFFAFVGFPLVAGLLVVMRLRGSIGA